MSIGCWMIHSVSCLRCFPWKAKMKQIIITKHPFLHHSIWPARSHRQLTDINSGLFIQPSIADPPPPPLLGSAGSLGVGWREDQSVWQAAEKEQSKGSVAASRPAIMRVLLFPGHLHIAHQLGLKLLPAFVSGNMKSLSMWLLFKLNVEY